MLLVALLTALISINGAVAAAVSFLTPLDAAGNSVKGGLVARFLSRRLGLDLFVSRPSERGGPE